MECHPKAGQLAPRRAPSGTAPLLAFAFACCFAARPTSAHAGPPPHRGIELAQGWVPVSWSDDGRLLAVTRWDRAGLWTVEVGTGRLETVSLARGAGFEAVWWNGHLLFKEVEDTGQGERFQRVVRVDVRTGLREVLAEGPLLGNPSVSRDGHVAWTDDRTLVVRSPEGHERRFQLPGYCNLAVISPGKNEVLFNDDDGRIGILTLADGRRRWLTEPGAYHRPSWSFSGALVAVRAPRGIECSCSRRRRGASGRTCRG